MKGYFISSQNAEELAHPNLNEIRELSQKTVIVITEEDVKRAANESGFNNFQISNENVECIANWFYKNYYDVLMETILRDYGRENKE